MELSGPNGVLTLSIPIVGGRDQKLPISEVKIDYTQTWQAKHFKAIYATYKNSPWFDYYESSLAELYKQQPSLLYQWNNLCIKWIFAKLKLNATMADITSFDQKEKMDNVVDYTNFACKKNEKMEQIFAPKYYQVFEDRTGFVPNMCILDMLCCEGPNTNNILKLMEMPRL